MESLSDLCTLCSIHLNQYPIVDGNNRFCCAGCQAVYQILSSKHQLDNIFTSPIFQQALKSGLISNPSLLDEIRKRKENLGSQTTFKYHLEISDMWCPSCADVIRLILLQEKGVVNCVIDYATDLAAIEFIPEKISKEKIQQMIASLGYQAHALENAENKKTNVDLYLRFGVAAFCSLNAMMFAYPLYSTYFDDQAHEDGKIFAWLSFFSAIPVLTYCMWPILKRFINSLKFGLLGMEALVMLGVSAAFGLSLYELSMDSNQVYFDSMTVIVTFVLLGKIIENKAKFSSKETLFRLHRSLPRRARKIFPDGTVEFASTKEIKMGDLLEVYAGEKIILDGEVVDGVGTCDESLMTGESMPIQKQSKSTLMAGSILQQGRLVFKVTREINESTLSQIINIVEQDLAHKSNYSRAIDRIIPWFVPLVLFVAFLTAGTFFWGNDRGLLNAVSVLLIACPCAIGIAAPLAESQVLQKLADQGVIIRNRGCLALMDRVTTFVFDKTGTVTEGQFRILEGIEKLSKDELEILKTITRPSNHLICKAIYQSLKVDCIKSEHIEESPSKGMKGIFKGQKALLGSFLFFHEQGIQIVEKPDQLDSEGVYTYVYFSPDSKKIFRLRLGDSIRGEVMDVIKNLQCHTVLLSGDRKESVESVARACGFDEFLFQMAPLQKRDYIEDLRNRQVVCMVGDGINDAPALTAAHVGISVVSASDISIQVSDILLTTDGLSVLPSMLRLIVRGQKILQQNLFWAFFYNAIGIFLAFCGLLTPIFAAFAMTISSLMVVFNSKRLT
ncbi:MAG: hypothetical protein BGO14_03720 [Chlamydiales bacterium 38-26]|nr:cadmium-translocating P-type ATPase [Chlamydiales bacterium]OJV09485.1 MAG: hypothetical protein BGO14_03720 [Chlamydiales bacterium 38-26]